MLLALLLAVFQIYRSASEAADLRRAADRAEMVRPIENYMATLDAELLAYAAGTDTASAYGDFDVARSRLEQQLADADVAPPVASQIDAILSAGPRLLGGVQSDSIGVADQIAGYAPILLTAKDAIHGSVGGEGQQIRVLAHALSAAVDARGHLLMQQLLVNQGGELTEDDLRTSLITLSGREPSGGFEIAQVLGAESADAKALHQQREDRIAILTDPASELAGNAQLLESLQATDTILQDVMEGTSSSVISAAQDKASAARTPVIRDGVILLAVVLIGLALAVVADRLLVRPLRGLRSAALRVAHEDLPAEVQRVQSGEDPPAVTPIPLHTSEEIGQVAHVVDELHEQALQLAGEQSRTQLQLSDMFETLSRRNRSLVDQQLALIDDLERREDDPQRLDALFKLDHLAARMRRNSANLLVLSGARVRREQTDPLAVVSILNAAASQVEQYQRVVTGTVPDSSIVGAVAGDIVHLTAELIDNALRYSPPTSQVRISAVHTNDRELLIEVSDSGLGMTESDQRMANTRLASGGEVTPYTARHMGLFVVGRLARQHGLVVQMRSSVAGEQGSGTTIDVFVPVALLATADGGVLNDPEVSDEPFEAMAESVEQSPTPPPSGDSGLAERPGGSGSAQAEGSGLPQRRPGASGIHGTPAGDKTPEKTETSGEASTGDADVIYQRLVSESLIDPTTLLEPMQSWQSLWDSGWDAAAQADEAPVEEHTEQGLPLRRPGARLVPGSAEDARGGRPNGSADAGRDDEKRVGSAAEGPIVRPDPDAIRKSLRSHLGGVRAGRSQARQEPPEADDQ